MPYTVMYNDQLQIQSAVSQSAGRVPALLTKMSASLGHISTVIKHVLPCTYVMLPFTTQTQLGPTRKKA